MITNRYVQANGIGVFWSEIPPCDHLVQIYETEGSGWILWKDSCNVMSYRAGVSGSLGG